MHNMGKENMAADQNIKFKKPLWILAWLDTALEKEKEKYKKCPVVPDMVPGHDAAQGWGYVVAGYFLVESAFKALVLMRDEMQVPKKHSLSSLFKMLTDSEQAILREYYYDFRGTIGETAETSLFPRLEDFLQNLDGDLGAGGDHIGSFDWRYYLIEERRSKEMPIVSVDYLHEIVFGCVRILGHKYSDLSEPILHTRSWRLHHDRINKYRAWLTMRMNSEGWSEIGDRLEILWGPDYRGRYDFYLSHGARGLMRFAEIPRNDACPVIDKREEIKAFDAVHGGDLR